MDPDSRGEISFNEIESFEKFLIKVGVFNFELSDAVSGIGSAKIDLEN